jgi:hypothetical protein
VAESPLLHVLAIASDVNPAERWVFIYDDASRPLLLETFGRFAADPDLAFNWYDAAILTRMLNERK